MAFDSDNYLEESFDNMVKKKKDRKNLINELSTFCDTDYSDYTLPSQVITNNNDFITNVKNGPKGVSKNSEFNDVDDWYHTLSNIKVNKKGWKHADEMFGDEGKKKKKKKKKGELTNYNDEFDTELRLLRNLLLEQNKFTQSLQTKYDTMESQKGTSRGVTKFTTDLIESITAARSLSMQLVDKTISAKKTIADLTMKEKEKFAKNAEGGDDMAGYASQFLKKMIENRGEINNFDKSDVTVQDYDENSTDDLFSDIDNSIVTDTDPNSSDYRSPDLDKYLKYEGRKIKIYALVNENDPSDYDFVAKDMDGNDIDDYPLPLKTNLSINRSTMIATDSYGEKYKIIWK